MFFIRSDSRFLSVCDFIDIFSAEIYNSLIDISFRVTQDSSTCIDHIYVNTPSSSKSGAIRNSVSDHNAMFCSLPTISKELISNEPIFFRDNSKKFLNAFETHLSWSLLSFNAFDKIDIDDKFNFFSEIGLWLR